MFTVNKPRLNGKGFSVDSGTIIATPNQPDDRLTSNSETIDNKSGSNQFSFSLIVCHKGEPVEPS